MIVPVNEFDPAYLDSFPVWKRSTGNQGTKSRKTYRHCMCAFDIETSRLDDIEQAFMYVWQFQIGEQTVIGHYWSEFLDMLQSLAGRMADGEYLMVFIHNASYEFQFVSGVYDFEPAEVFATDSRRVCKFSMFKHFEFRCSYMLTNMSLDRFLQSMQVENKKVRGFDYDKVRYPDTPLNDLETAYIVNDVKGLVQAIEKKMSLDGDTPYTLPLTSTGYIRRMVRRSMQGYAFKALPDQLPPFEVFTLLREAFRGGNTHANRHYVGVTLEGVKSYDRSSSYPEVQCNLLFPIAPWREVKDLRPSNVIGLMKRWKKPLLMRVVFTGICMRDYFDGFPYIPYSKCMGVTGEVLDNGRILSADRLCMTITDIDLGIILRQYRFDDMEVLRCYESRYGKLPYRMTDIIKRLYTNKTSLKGVQGSEYLYATSKALLNSVYGMTVQSPVKHSLIYSGGVWSLDQTPDEDLLAKAYRRAFLNYSWGVWTTAHARNELQTMLEIAGHDAVYVDTDSVKFLGEHDFTAYNEKKKRLSTNSGAYATDPKGVTHYMGVCEYEGTYEKFRTLGAKRYAYQKGGRLHTTIAGVRAVPDPSGQYLSGGEELEQRGGLDALWDGFTFRRAGGTEAIYNDSDYGTIEREGHLLNITKNVVIKPRVYTLGLTEEYLWIIEHPNAFPGNMVLPSYEDEE